MRLKAVQRCSMRAGRRAVRAPSSVGMRFLKPVAVAASLLITAALFGSSAAQAATPPEVSSYLDDRVAWVTKPGPGGCTRELTLAATTINGGRVVGYVSSSRFLYRPPVNGGSYYLPARFSTATPVPMMFSDAGHFAYAQAQEVTIQIILNWTAPVVSITLHEWGNTVVTFPFKGANNSVIWGDDNPNSHVALVLSKIECQDVPD